MQMTTKTTTMTALWREYHDDKNDNQNDDFLKKKKFIFFLFKCFIAANPNTYSLNNQAKQILQATTISTNTHTDAQIMKRNNHNNKNSS